MKHVVVGTAGHVDHGKSALVLALTGTDPDRLPEEKARGVTIDLGFAHTIESEMVLSFVDVPGHERFVRNMLAGVGGMDLVMLIVAADESVMPQTREHFAICRLLRVPAGLVVVTKADLADEATLAVVQLEIRDLVAGSFLEKAPVMPVSARTGAGIPELRRAIAAQAAAATSRPSEGPPRLPIDRVFSMRGFGTIATGTLMAGRIRQDDDLELQPSGRPVKVRGLQVHGDAEALAVAGQRVAVNLAGVAVADVERGETLTVPEATSVTRRADVSIELLPSARPLKHGARVRLHHGTREVIGRVLLTGGSELVPGQTRAGRVHLETPAVLVRGDRFILREYSPLSTIAGGVILDPLPPSRGVRTPLGVARLAALADPAAEPAAVVSMMVEEAGLRGVPVPRLAGRAGVAWEERAALIAALERRGTVVTIGESILSSTHLAGASCAVLAHAKAYHVSHPLAEGLPREELRERLFASAAAGVFEHVLGAIVVRGEAVVREHIALAGHHLVLGAEEERAREALVRVLSASGLMPPDLGAIAAESGTSREAMTRVATLLVRQRVLVRLGDLLFHQDALATMKEDLRSASERQGLSTIDVPGFKTRYGVTRKYAIPLLEFLDRERVTRRVGDTRHILPRAAASAAEP